MTFFEHALVGANGAIALGLGKRYGWPLVAWAGVAAVIPDWDGLTIFFGGLSFADGHRVWGHNFLMTALIAAVVGYLFYRTKFLERTWQSSVKRWPGLKMPSNQITGDCPENTGENSLVPARPTLFLWIIVGVISSYSHLACDIIFASGENLPNWGVPLLWPFAKREFELPLIPWGDVGITIILGLSMFAMVRWPKRLQTIAAGSLFFSAIYAMLHGLFL